MLAKKLLGAAKSAVVDAYYNLVTLLLPGNGTNGAQNNTFLDSSSNNFTITRNGNTTQGTFTPFSATGWGNYFAGSSDYLTAPSNTAFALGTGDFTIECWFYLTNTGNKALWGIGDGTTSGGVMFRVETASNRFNFYNTTDILFTGAAIVPFVWYHVAVVRSAGTLRVYLNGLQYGSSVANTTNIAQNIFYVGAAKIGATVPYNPMEGYLSNTRVVKGTAVYTSNFTPSPIPLTAITNTSLLTCQSNRFSDNSTNAFAITANGTPSVQAFSPFLPTAAYSAGTNGGSGYFDGTGDYVSAPSNSVFNFGTGNFTIEFWVYYNTIGGPQTLLDINYGTAPSCTLQPSSGSMIFYTNGTATSITSSVADTVGVWSHYAVVRNGTTITMYRNGASVGSATYSGNVGNSSATVYVGGSLGGGGYYTNGYVSNFRMTNTAVYTAAFTPPTAPATAISGTALLLNFTNAGITDATAKNDLETVGNAQISTTQSKFGGSSMYFDGAGDYLVVPDAPASEVFGSGDFTVEFWMYANTVASGTRDCFGIYDGGSTGIIVGQVGANVRFFCENSGAIITSSTTISASQWYHIAAVKSGTTGALYINGTSVGTATISSPSNTNFSIGRAGNFNGNYFDGYIDDFRITKGYARYTANFTAPTAPFPLQ
jgi:hypothetical protein